MASAGERPNELAIQMYKQACDFVFKIQATVMKGRFLYRNKAHKYFKDIRKSEGKMVPYKKDYNGDPGNPINGHLNGLFFMANVSNKTGETPGFSNFGPCRVSIPIYFLLRNFYPRGLRLFFADFFCMNSVNHSPHYVTVVMCENGTDDFLFCKEYLLPLPKANPFFMLADDGQSFLVNSKIWVELFYMKDINIEEALKKGAFFEVIKDSGPGSCENGKLKSPGCKICNRNDPYFVDNYFLF